MANVLFQELGFPILLVDPPMVEVRGHQIPDINLKDLQEQVFRMLVVKPFRLTGDEVRFIRKYLRMRQTDLASVLNMANHSVVSQWESRQETPSGMDYNTEVVLRLWMASKSGLKRRLSTLLTKTMKGLETPTNSDPLRVEIGRAA